MKLKHFHIEFLGTGHHIRSLVLKDEENGVFTGIL